MKKALIVLLVLFMQVIAFAQEIDKNKIDEFILKVRDKLKLETGLSVGIVIGDKAVFSKGYGFVNVEKKIKTKSESPFYIASATKSFTAALVKVFQEKDSIDIDVPISTYLPEFKFANENLKSNLISIRDLLTHRSGILDIPVVIRTAYTGQHTNKKLLELYQKARFTTSEFKYGNDGYVFTSLILDKLFSKPWQRQMNNFLFEPLAMKNTSCWISDYNQENLKAYTTKNGEIEELPFLKADNTMHAAGGIVSTANDLCNWLIFNLNGGNFNGKQILSKRSMAEIHSSQEGLNKIFWKYKRFAYGLGWYLSDYNGELLVHHFGGYAGARSHISFMPEYNLGVVALSNDDGDAFYVVDLIADYIYNSYLKKDADKIAEDELNIILSKIEKRENSDKDQPQKEKVVSQFNMEEISGYYSNNDFGEVEITNSEIPEYIWGNLKSDLIPFSEAEFKIDLSSFKAKVGFEKVDGKIAKLIFKGPTTIVFEKLK